MRYFFPSLLLTVLMGACSGSEHPATQTRDSTEKKEVKKVDEMLRNDDSLIKAKEKELLKKYGGNQSSNS